MPHGARVKSESGFYHVVSKGDGGQVIFESEKDRRRYLATLEEAAAEFKIEIHAYCLMSNHVHLLVRDDHDALGPFMKQLNERYALHFSKVTGRVGHVFQGRYWSEPITEDRHYLAVLRYIHANPEAAGICKARDYAWSSYRAFSGIPTFVATDMALAMLDGFTGFEALHESGCRFAKPFSGSRLNLHLSPDELQRIALEVLGRNVLNAIKTLPPRERALHLERLSSVGFTPSEIVRVTGLGEASIRKTLKVRKRDSPQSVPR